MRNKLLSTTSIAALALATGVATSAFSPKAIADGYEPAGKGFVAPRRAVNWSGFYLGAHGGLGRANFGGCLHCNALDASGGPEETLFFGSDLDIRGILGGVHGGFNWQHGRTVFGIEGDWSFMGENWDDNIIHVASSRSSATISGKLDSLASVRARIGHTFGQYQQVLLFLSAGAAWADAEAMACSTQHGSAPENFCPNPMDGPEDRINIDFDDVGAVVGGGMEIAFTDQFRIRLDGSYYFFDDSRNIGVVSSAGTNDHLDFDNVYTFRVGGSWYFTRPHRPVAALK